MPDPDTLESLQRTIAVHERAIAQISKIREAMVERRRGAADHVMQHIDESLQTNQRTLDSLQRVLQLAREQLSSVRARTRRKS